MVMKLIILIFYLCVTVGQHGHNGYSGMYGTCRVVALLLPLLLLLRMSLSYRNLLTYDVLMPSIIDFMLYVACGVEVVYLQLTR